MIRTRHVKSGVFTQGVMEGKNDFMDNLSYELYVVQLPCLALAERLDIDPGSPRGKLFALLKLFDQRARKTGNDHRLRLFRRVFPEFLDRVAKRLQAAAADNPDLERQMSAEDHYLRLLQQQYNKIAWFRLNKKETEEKLSQANHILEAEIAKSKEKDKAPDEKDQMILDIARRPKAAGHPEEEIQRLTGLPEETIDGLGA